MGEVDILRGHPVALIASVYSIFQVEAHLLAAVVDGNSLASLVGLIKELGQLATAPIGQVVIGFALSASLCVCVVFLAIGVWNRSSRRN